MEILRLNLHLDLTPLLLRTRKEGPELRSTHIQRRAGTEGPSGERRRWSIEAEQQGNCESGNQGSNQVLRLRLQAQGVGR